MKIFSTAQMRAWDEYTIEKEPITSLHLMNRAARVFTDWFVQRYPDTTRAIVVIAGTGNNGGDGLAIARMLDQAQYAAKVLICDFGTRHSIDFEDQMTLLSPLSAVYPTVYKSFDAFQQVQTDLIAGNNLIIDALFGSGLTRPLEGDWAKIVAFINQSGLEIVSVDVPSGLFCDAPTLGGTVVCATATFTFQAPKWAFFFPENANFLGVWASGSIGLHPDFEQQTQTDHHYLTRADVTNVWNPRKKFAHKGTFGHALLVAGSWGKMGAAVLAARACLRSGVGLLTVHSPRCGNIVLQSSVPEAMVSADRRAKYWTEVPDLSLYASIGVGPGIGRAPETVEALQVLITGVNVPFVLDADALNILAEYPELLQLLPENSIITPHPKEFERLFGKTTDDFQRNRVQVSMAKQHRIFIILKGAHTAIACPDGTCWFNSTGNPGMATGGAGDVLTGVLTGLLAQGYAPKSACLWGVYLHGLAGDLAASAISQEGLTAGVLVEYLGKAWL
jgi:NAD(P)H-hydrate epimerase